jgi:predicted nucleotidyltransferase
MEKNEPMIMAPVRCRVCGQPIILEVTGPDEVTTRFDFHEECVPPPPPKGAILWAFRGSVAHGMFIRSDAPDSIDDIDLMGVVIAPTENYLGRPESAWGSRGMAESWEGKFDIVIYELRKFVTLLLKSNPNVVAMLWLPEDKYVHVSPLGQRLIAHRHLFMSRKAYDSFTGYAQQQIDKMRGSAYQGYMGAKRKELVDRFGYDTKNAAHCIRLLRMGCEVLRYGEYRVNRSGIDSQELLDIKRGKWPIKRVEALADALFDDAATAVRYSVLPEEPDYEKAEALLVSMLKEALWP